MSAQIHIHTYIYMYTYTDNNNDKDIMHIHKGITECEKMFIQTSLESALNTDY